MGTIICLTDYKGNFGSKWGALPYRSGFDKELISNHFKGYGYFCRFINFAELCNSNIDITNKIVLYTSAEDIGYHYKDYIEDVVQFCEESKAITVPSFKHLRANNNKVFMELLRRSMLKEPINHLQSYGFGTLEELQLSIDSLKYPVVIKEAKGAQSTGVYLARNKDELIKKVKSISRTKNFILNLKDSLRQFRHKQYKRESNYRGKYILQEFIPGLINDWKILVFGKRYFILTRHTRKNDFRASGSHTNYLSGTKSIIPAGIFDFANNIFNLLDVPHISLDIVFNDGRFYLLEFQSVYFGTSVYNLSDAFYIKEGDHWIPKENNISIEEIYVDCIASYLVKSP